MSTSSTSARQPGAPAPGERLSITPTIETERLVLRGWRMDDFGGLAELMADPEAGRYITPYSKPLDAMASWYHMMTLAGMWAVQGFGLFVMEEKASGRFVGRAGPWHPLGWPGFEVGWAVHPAARGKGYATEAARGAIEWSRATLGVGEIVHAIAVDNAASQRVARRLGAVPDGRIDLFGRTSEIWRSRVP
jgi:RimJ/RimL family protein N-acetyltransferase